MTGTIERFWTGSATFGWTQGAGTGHTGSLTAQNIYIYPNASGSGLPYIMLSGSKFGRHRVVQRPGANLMTETLDFIGLDVYSGSV